MNKMEFENALFKCYNAHRLAMSESEYREFIRVAKDRAMPTMPRTTPTPHSCAGCFYLEPSGLCGYFNEYPPAQFIEKVNECDYWAEDLPF